jgi:hypothetical protein
MDAETLQILNNNCLAPVLCSNQQSRLRVRRMFNLVARLAAFQNPAKPLPSSGPTAS